MAVNLAGVGAVATFYLVILAAGIWAAWKQRRNGSATAESIMLARRDISLFMGILTMTGECSLDISFILVGCNTVNRLLSSLLLSSFLNEIIKLTK